MVSKVTAGVGLLLSGLLTFVELVFPTAVQDFVDKQVSNAFHVQQSSVPYDIVSIVIPLVFLIFIALGIYEAIRWYQARSGAKPQGEVESQPRRVISPSIPSALSQPLPEPELEFSAQISGLNNHGYNEHGQPKGWSFMILIENKGDEVARNVSGDLYIYGRLIHVFKNRNIQPESYENRHQYYVSINFEYLADSKEIVLLKPHPVRFRFGKYTPSSTLMTVKLYGDNLLRGRDIAIHGFVLQSDENGKMTFDYTGVA